MNRLPIKSNDDAVNFIINQLQNQRIDSKVITYGLMKPSANLLVNCKIIHVVIWTTAVIINVDIFDKDESKLARDCYWVNVLTRLNNGIDGGESWNFVLYKHEHGYEELLNEIEEIFGEPLL